MPYRRSTKPRGKNSRLPFITMCLIIIVSKVHCLSTLIPGITAAQQFLWSTVAALYRTHRYIPHSPHSRPKNQKSTTHGLSAAQPILHSTPEITLWVTLLMDATMTPVLLNLRFMHRLALTVTGTIGSCPRLYLICRRTMGPVHLHQYRHFMSSRFCIH